MSTAILEEGTFVEVEPEMMKQAEDILDKIGISYADAVKLFTRQIILRNGFPIELKITENNPSVPCINDITEQELNSMLDEAHKNINAGNFHNAEEVRALMEAHYAKF